jgi:LemA protein
MFWFILLAIVILAGWVITMFNGLVILKNRVNEAQSDIDVQLKRRHDLIPNLINTVKGYAVHERELFENVTRARTEAMNAQGMAAKAQSENMLSNTLKSLFAVAENYPELKANQNFLALQEELSDTENKIMSSRRFYNTNVRDYNIRTEIFPTSIIAGWFKFMRRELFEIDDVAERAVPNVDFGHDASVASTPQAPHDGGQTTPPTPPVAPAPASEEPATPPTPPAPHHNAPEMLEDPTDDKKLESPIEPDAPSDNEFTQE